MIEIVSDRDQGIIKLLVERHNSLKSGRLLWEPNWQVIGEHVHPDRGDFTTFTVSGQARTNKIFDITAPWSLDVFAAGLESIFTSSAERWFEIEPVDKSLLKKNRRLRIWAEETTQVLYERVFNTPATNFQPQAHELYLDIGAFGTSPMLIDDIPGEPIRFKTYHLGNCWIAENHLGVVDTLYRRFYKTGRQLLNQYKKKLTRSVIENITKKPYDNYECIHIVEPNDVFQKDSELSVKKKFSSIFLLMSPEKIILEESGYDEFPYVVPRWKKSAEEVYGRSVAMGAKPAILMANEMMKTYIRGEQNRVAPPLQVPDDGFLMPIRLKQFGLNFYRSGTNDRIEPLQFGNGSSDDRFLVKAQEQIMRSFFVDLFDEINQEPRKSHTEQTRAEFLGRENKKTRRIGPMSGRMQVEFLTPMIQRVYNIARKRGMIDPPPTDVGMKIRYISQANRAQRQVKLQNALQWMETFVPLLELKPEAGDRFNADEYVKWSHDLLDAPEGLLHTDEDVQQTRDQRAQQQQAQQQLEGGQAASEIGVNAARATDLLRG